MARYDRSSLLLAIIALLIVYIFHIHLSEPHVLVAKSLSKDGGKASAGASQRNPGQRIAMITMNTKETTYDILSLSNKFSYANKHGYDLEVAYEGPGPWHKLTMIENAINTRRYDWIWWMDFDTLITNKTIKIADIVEETLQKHQDPNSVSMMLTADCFPMNTGSMIYRGDPQIIEFLDLIRQCGTANPGHSEQDCIRDVVGVNNDPEAQPVVSKKWAKRFTYVPQYKINGFPEEIKCYDKESRAWTRGDFLIHFAGAWAHLDINDPTGFLMRKYQNEIID